MKNMNKDRFKIIWRFSKKYLSLFIIAEICILVSYTISLLLPLNLTKLTDKVLISGQHKLLKEVIITYAILFAVSVIFNLIYAFIWQTLNNNYIVDIKNELFQKTIFSKASFLSKMNSGDIMSRIDCDSEQFIHVIQRNLFHFFNSALLCVGIIFMVTKINVFIALILSLAAIIPIIVTKIFGKFTEQISKENREITGIYTGRVFEILKGFRELRLLCAEWWATNQILSPLNKLIRLGNRSRRIDLVVNKSIYLINLTTSLVIYGFSAYLIADGKLTIGLFLAIIEYVALLHKKFNWMLRIYLDWFGRKVSIDRVTEILELESESDEGISVSQIDCIEFKNVTFAYDQNIILNNISFSIQKGEHVAFVGASGVGKSTIIGLLMKFYEPQSGEILINGVNINLIKIGNVRQLFGIVSQDILLFDETVRYNLLLGSRHNDQEIWEALEYVKLQETINNLPMGLDTKISAASYGLSGGQKQRLMIARLLLKNVSVVILDEATSALDVDTEQKIKIQSCLNTTSIIISHRLSTIKGCDKIIVIEDGRIKMIGVHDKLIQESECYISMFAPIKEKVVTV